MRHALPYPKSFPTCDEATFLKMAVADDATFPDLWRAWKTSIVWDEIDYATARLLTYIYPRLHSLGIKDELTERVKGVHKATWVKNQLYLQAAKEIAEICQEEQIPVLVLKGIPLIFEVYKDKGARPLGDADILVRPEDGRRLTELLIGRGWRFAKEWAPERHNPVSSVYKIIKATELGNSRGIDVDVHYNIFAADHGMTLLDVLLLKDLPSLSFPERFWRNSVPMNLDGVPCLRLSNEDTLIHLIVHGTEGNTYRTFRWVLDSYLLIKHLPVDWNKVIAHAREFGYILDVRLALSYLKEELGAPIPDSVIEEICAVTLTNKEIGRYYAVANIEHTKRFRMLGNIPLLWYAYWKFEPRSMIKPLLFHRYLLRSWGLSNLLQTPGFVLTHYKRKLRDKNPGLLKDVQKVGRDGLYIVGGKAISFFASFAVITVMARYVPREVIGSYNLIIAVLAIVSIATLPGMNDALMRAIARGHEGTIHSMMRRRFMWGLVGSFLALIIGALTWLSGNKELGMAFLIAAPFVPLTDTFSNLAVAFLQGKKQFGRSALTGAAYYLLLAVFSIPVFILSDNLLVIVACIFAAQALIGYVLYRGLKVEGKEVDTESVRLGIHLSIMQAFAIVAANADKILLWIFFGPVMLAIYAIAATPVSKAYQMLPISILAIPHLSAQTFTKATRITVLKNTALLFLLSIPGTAFVIWLAPSFYELFFPLYPESIPYFQLLFLGLALSPVLLLRSALVAFKETRALYLLEAGMPFVRILLMFALAFFFGMYGLVIGALLAILVGSVLTLVLFMRSKPVS